ncbi:MAG: glycosyl transferase [Clostridiaceae bacterium]|jgi:1,2-diacylglycerol 3-alpha-glucosyltransferase|nr:glycosyl transferase [Clostridiaceae bacterium]
MKVLITTDTYLPMINGVVTSILNLHKQLKELGHDVRILTLSQKGYDYVDGDVYYLKSFRLRIYPDARVRRPFNSKLINEIIDWAPDIIHSQTEFTTMIDAKSIALKLKIPQIHTYHTMYEDYLQYFLRGKVINRPRAAKLIKLLLNSMDRVIAPTEKVEKALREYGVETQVSIVPTGIDLIKFQRPFSEQERNALREKYGFNKENKVLMYLGRIAKEKNIEEIIDLFNSSCSAYDNYRLLIVGGGPYLKILKDKVKEMNLGKKVVFAGMVSPDQVYKYYKIGDTFVTASTSESQGLTYIEALACGCPVLCKYDKCIEGIIIDNKTGFTYNSSHEFNNKLKLINNELLQKMKYNCIEKSKEYSSETFGRKIEKIYTEQILNKKYVEMVV